MCNNLQILSCQSQQTNLYTFLKISILCSCEVTQDSNCLFLTKYFLTLEKKYETLTWIWQFLKFSVKNLVVFAHVIQPPS